MEGQGGEGAALVRYDAMCLAIQQARAVDEVKNIRDKALALEVYAKQARNTDAERWATEIRIRAERRAGELLLTMEKAKGTVLGGNRALPPGPEPTLSDLGISKPQSSRWQQLAEVPEDEFERALSNIKPSTTGIIKQRYTVGAVPSHDTCTLADLHDAVSSGDKFGCIYADPPWLYDNQGTRAATGNHYDGLTVEQLCALPVADLAADDAHLHLWITNGFLFDAPRIFDAWGFEFRSSFVWVKPQMGIGNYWRNSHEFMLTGIRGNAKRFNDHSIMSWLQCDRGAHSAKPEQVRSFIERASPGPRLELFARRVAPGWTSWGNQIERCLFAPRENAA